MPDSTPAMTPNPSTYRQVIANMQEINRVNIELGEKYSKLEETLNTLKADVEGITDPPATGGIVTTEEGVKVVGVHVNTENSDANNLIASYQQGVTWEFKNISVIGLTDKTGMTGKYCAVMTVKYDAPIEGESGTLTEVGEFQMAYSPEGIYFYKRVPKEDGSWDEWVEQKLGDEARQQFVENETEPTDQLPGEYWVEPIEAE